MVMVMKTLIDRVMEATTLAIATTTTTEETITKTTPKGITITLTWLVLEITMEVV